MNKVIKSLKNMLTGILSFLLKLWKHPKGRRGIIIIAAIVLVAIFAPLLTRYDPYNYNITEGLQQPSSAHWLGTDKNGVDILTQLLYGTRISLLIGLSAGIGVTLLGAMLGCVAGYFGKISSAIILNVINVLLVIPTLPLMIILNNISSSYVMMIFIFVALGWSGTARMIRAQVLSLRESGYVRSAELAGASRWYVMWKHIIPAVSNLLIMNCALSCAGFMIAEAGLSFIGLGDPNSMSWGKILVRAQESAFTSGLWAWVLAPGVAIFITVTGFMQIGYAIEDICNPRMVKQNKAAQQFHKLDSSELDNIFASMDDNVSESAKSENKALSGERSGSSNG
ncbi:MAG: ABC transporter permease [Clostridiales bacterium]|nr:ABC transporter permease [Clostridiales bacterium]